MATITFVHLTEAETLFRVDGTLYLGWEPYTIGEYFEEFGRTDQTISTIRTLFSSDEFDSENFNWERDSEWLAAHGPEHIIPYYYNWKKASWAIACHCPRLVIPWLYNDNQDWAINAFA